MIVQSFLNKQEKVFFFKNKYFYFYFLQKVFFQEPRLLIKTHFFLYSSYTTIVPYLTKYFNKDLNRVAVKVNFSFPTNFFFYNRKNIYFNFRLLKFGLKFNKFDFEYLNKAKNFFFFQ